MDEHFGHWWAVIAWIVTFGLFLLFIPFYKKSQRKPASVYLAFVVALALEMFGVPLTMYIVSGVIGASLPEGVLCGHTLVSLIGEWGMLAGIFCYLIGIGLIVWGWRDIYKHYWSKEEGKGELVDKGLYRFIRHPQYTGFLLITLGMLLEWATLPMLVMWPMLVVLYYRLAKREEKEMELHFGDRYVACRQRTSMFLPVAAVKRLFSGKKTMPAADIKTTDPALRGHTGAGGSETRPYSETLQQEPVRFS